MKTDKRILIAFFLNLFFSMVEFVGGTITGSIAILSDSIHDLGDSLSIGLSYILEKISKKKPDEKYTYGYLRHSVLGSVITTAILLCGSVAVIYNAVLRFLNPTTINYNGMIGLAVFGALINFCAAYFTSGGGSLNQKSVNLHMLEDVLGWIVVLVGAVVMKLTDFTYIDPLLSIGVAVFIFINAIQNLKEVMDIFLEKTPAGISVSELTEHVKEIDGVIDVHHVHVRSIDGYSNAATLHVVTDADSCVIKRAVKEELLEHGIAHTTVEIEGTDEVCCDKECNPAAQEGEHDHHHHHHHHHH